MLMTREQIKEHLQIGESTLRKLMDAQAIPFLRIHNKIIRFELDKVTTALADRFEGKPYVGKARSPEALAATTRTLEKARLAIIAEKRARKKSRKPTREKKPTTT